jgi:hypothetical protein
MSTNYIVSKNWIKQLHTLPVLHFSRCLTTEYSETTAQFNGNFDTDYQFYVPNPKCPATFRTNLYIYIYIYIYTYMYIYTSEIGYFEKFRIVVLKKANRIIHILLIKWLLKRVI